MQNINLANIDQILQTHGIDINSIPENQRRFHLMTVEEIKRLNTEINDLRAQFQFTNATVLNMQNRQNTADQHIANTNTALNLQTERINLLAEQLERLRNEMSMLGEQRARQTRENIANNRNDNQVVAEPLPGEEEFLKKLVAGNVDKWEEEIEKVKSNCLSSLIKAGIDGALGVYNFDRTRKKLNENDERSLTEAFMDSFTKEAIKTPVNTVTDPRMILGELGIKVAIVATKYVYAKYQDSERNRRLRDYWNEEMIQYKRDMISALREPTEEYFHKMLMEYGMSYTCNYDRDDASIEIRGHGFTNAPLYFRKFSKIPEYEQTINEHTRMSEKIYEVGSFKQNKFDINDYISDRFQRNEREEKIAEFKWKFRLYRALNCEWSVGRWFEEKIKTIYYSKTNEFEDQYFCGDSLDGAHSVITTALLFIFVVPGLIYGAGAGAARSVKEVQWGNNARRLEEILLTCINMNSPEALKQMIARREILVRLENYVEMSGSQFAKKFFEQCKKNQYIGVKDGKTTLFDTAFDLYCKLKNICIANRDNYLKHSFMKELVKPEEVEFSKMIDDSIKKATEGLKNLPNAITETEEITRTTTIDSEGKKTTKNEIKKVQKINPDATSNIIYNVNNIGAVNRQFL